MNAIFRVLTFSIIGLASLPLAQASKRTLSGKDQFFGSDKLYYFLIKNWDPQASSRETLAHLEGYKNVKGSQLLVYRLTNPSVTEACPVMTSMPLLNAEKFDLGVTGQATRAVPKISYRIKLKNQNWIMKTINLKSMWFDASQMREALVWKMFRRAGVMGLHQTYARLCIQSKGEIQARYLGLYNVMDHPDASYFEENFPANPKGNYFRGTYQAADLGPANFSYRNNEGKDDGSQYHLARDIEGRSYSLKSFSDKPENMTYDDLAQFIRVIHGKDVMPNADSSYFQSDEFRKRLESVFDVPGFLRWAALNNLLGAWDNHWATPANYGLYNSGGIGRPFFSWIPWDYDATLGAGDKQDHNWMLADIFDWEKSTLGYGGFFHNSRDYAYLPLVQNILQNPHYREAYKTHLGQYIREFFNENWVNREMKNIWSVIHASVALEQSLGNSTGRGYTFQEIYEHINGKRAVTGSYESTPILEFVRGRTQSVLRQLHP